jgi:hypothetical protein
LLKILMVGAGKGAGKVAGEFNKRYQFQLPNGIKNGSRLNSGPQVPKIVKRDTAQGKPPAGHNNTGNKNDISRGILGQWQNVNETMSARARAYQQQITGRYGQAYIVEGVKFDGLAAGVLIDAKGPGYTNFAKNGKFRDWFTGAEDLVKQAKNQLRAANGVPIRWHIAESDAVNAIRKLFARERITGIEIVHTPVSRNRRTR